MKYSGYPFCSGFSFWYLLVFSTQRGHGGGEGHGELIAFGFSPVENASSLTIRSVSKSATTNY